MNRRTFNRWKYINQLLPMKIHMENYDGERSLDKNSQKEIATKTVQRQQPPNAMKMIWQKPNWSKFSQGKLNRRKSGWQKSYQLGFFHEKLSNKIYERNYLTKSTQRKSYGPCISLLFYLQTISTKRSSRCKLIVLFMFSMFKLSNYNRRYDNSASEMKFFFTINKNNSLRLFWLERSIFKSIKKKTKRKTKRL